MARPPFKESVAIERRYWEPLGPEFSSTSHLRRRLFQGHVLTADDGVALGGSNGLLGACVRSMEEWGYEFETTTTQDGKKGYKLKNPSHEPTEHVRKTPGPRRNKPKDDGDDAFESVRNGTRESHRDIHAKLLSGGPISCAESMAMGASSAFLRKLVSRLQTEEGYRFDIKGVGMDRTYTLKKMPKGARPPRAPSKSLANTPVPAVPMRNGHADVADMMFGELELPPPKLGGSVRIVGMMLEEDEDGEESVKLAFKNGSGTWMARVEGYVDAES